jgi:hypothetical protein
MGLLHWLQENWFDLLQTAAIVASFVAMSRDKRKEKVQNRLYFTARHGELSRREVTDARLSRINQPVLDLKAVPITTYEENHIREKFHNFAATFYAEKNGVYTQPAALPEDIGAYFALPIPRAVWGNLKTFLDPDFVTFVEGHLLGSLRLKQTVSGRKRY